MLTIEEFNEGTSSVEKYMVTKENKKYLVRLYDRRFMSDRYAAFENMKLLHKNGVSVPKIYKYGELNDNTHGYAVVEWIEGKTLDKLLIDDEETLKYGKQAAHELLKMHDIEPTTEIDIYEKFLKSLNKKVQKVKSLNVELDYDLINKFVSKYSEILKDKKTSIIHGDIHPGNMVIKDDKLFLIDLDVCTNNYAWIDLITNSCNMDYPKFYTVLIDEYFNKNIPDDFWIIYDLYGILYCLDYILYCNRIGNKTIDDGIKTFNKFLEDNFKEETPQWFDKKILRKER